MKDLYYVNVDVEGVASNTKINGVSVADERKGGIKTETLVNKWLSNNQNILELEISAIADRTLANVGAGVVTVFLHDNSQEFPTPKVILAKVAFPSEDVTFSKGQTSAVLASPFELKNDLTMKFEREAEVVSSLTIGDKKQIVGSLDKLRKALLQGDTKLAVSLQAYKIEEDARLEGKSADHLKNIASEMFEMIAKEKNVVSPSMSIDDLKYNILWGGKLVHVFREEGGALRFENEEVGFEIPVYMAKINGAWAIVR